jgi:hypothetical protein
MLQAKVKPDARHKTVTAFGGHEFTKHDWTYVPEHVAAAEVEANPFLDVRSTAVEPVEAPLVDELPSAGLTAVEPPEVVKPEPAPPPAARPKRKR